MSAIFDPAIFDPAIFDTGTVPVAVSAPVSSHRRAPVQRQRVTVEATIPLAITIEGRISVQMNEDWLLDLPT